MEQNKLTKEELMKWSKEKLINFILNEKNFWLEMLQSFNPKVKKDDNNKFNAMNSLIVSREEPIRVTNAKELIEAINKLDKRKIIIFDEGRKNWGSSLAVPREASIPNTIIDLKNRMKGGKLKDGKHRKSRR